MPYPDLLIKGITNRDSCVDEDGKAKPDLFQFSTSPRGKDGLVEESINWFDDKGALTQIQDQRKNGDIQFKGGYAIIIKKEIDFLVNHHNLVGLLSYERDVIVGINPYHGNILLQFPCRPDKKNYIREHIAFNGVIHPDGIRKNVNIT